ncbi:MULTISPECIES: non-ribosomal peptide synthetase [unclassified Leptolyngbya]|uniref:amino acid adenylation domain-containing protein n=1 Tax=unclassified Leptolyngbya TaxID=2650499 RepID=UPI001684265E|nr:MULTISPECIES: non-ribosomal peptide synthetase [unclassified Leptolyngbya]MBD1911607.1 amino acid adenylation domain-containing protein [Leptolyngbya sp. FACHB-8]MBD2155220.1 amino acid adenylation domain-containing protein [Leptolyngbya sp. FACHB-16]
MSFEQVLVPVEASVCEGDDNSQGRNGRAERSFEPSSLTSKSQPVKKMRSDMQLPWDFLKNPTTPHQFGFISFCHADSLPEIPHQPFSPLLKHPSSFWLTVFYGLLFRYTQQTTLDLDVTLVNSNNTPQKPRGIALTLDETESMQTLAHQLSSAMEAGLPLPTPATVAFTFVTEAAATSSEAEAHILDQGTPDLHLVLVQTKTGLQGTLAYNTHLFRPETIERLAGHLGQLAEGAIATPNAPIASLPLLTPSEKLQMFVEWGSPTVEYPRLPVFTAIEAHAAERPEAIAVRFLEQALSYNELNQRANQLAHYLVAQGVTPGSRVAACFEPSLDVSVALLAIFKAGGTYVPLDPSYPAERLGIILEDTQPQVLLTQTHLQSVVPALVPATFCLDRDWAHVAALPTHNLNLSLDLNQTAYIVYTSGTTGKPKGVMASHGNLVNYIRVAVDTYRFGPDIILPSMARYTFSITFFELLLPLVAGGQLVILERDRVLDFKRMIQLLEEINTIHASPSLLRKLIAYIHDNGLNVSRFDNLKHVSSGGDLVSADLQEAMKRAFRNAEIFVIYGCSEVSCMGCTFFAGDRTVTKTWVGKPFPNVMVRLYDGYLNPVPVGMVGEICFSGDGITQGYLNRDELTQEKFIYIDGQRFYRTGDLGRFDADGNVQILGRSDFQIQLRGMRVEPGEIEITLRQCPGVRDSVVALKPLWRDEEGLVAYVVLDPAQPATTDTMRRFLQAKLPDYMVPSAFQVLEALPLNMNGKVDRKALPDPDLSQGNSDTPYVAPRTELEKSLADVWAAILGVERVGIENDFFTLGGHSLMAAQVIARIQENLEIDLPLRRLFEFPTIAGLAEFIENDSTERQIIPQRSNEQSAPLSFAQQRLWYLDQLEPDSYAYHICKAIRLQGSLDVAALQQALDAIMERHEPLRTCFVATNGIPSQVILPHQPFELPLIDLSQRAAGDRDAELQKILTREEQRPFTLSMDLMLRATLVRLQPEEHVLQVVVHHICSDGLSMEILFRELRDLYQAFRSGQPNPLVALPVQYADFAEWQRQWFAGEVLEQYLGYWKETLQGITPLELPTDYPRPATQSYSGQSHTRVISGDLAQSLKKVSQQEGATLFMTLLAAFKVLLGRMAGQEDVVVGTPIAERDRPELEPLIGFFINTVVLRTDLSHNPSFRELLGRVRQTALGAYAHQAMPFEKLVEELHPERDLSRTPIFQVWFNMFNFEGIPVELADLDVQSLSVAEPASKFDITLYVGEKDGELWVNLVSNADLFSAARMEEMLVQYEYLLQQIAAAPETPIPQLSLVTPGKAALLPDPQLPLTYDAGEVIYHEFVQWSDRTPQQPAVIDSHGTWTYATLNERSNQLANYLVSQGIQPQDGVAIYASRSASLVWAMLGILKAGAAVTVLDSAYPAARLADYLDIAQPKGLVVLEAAGEFPEELQGAIANHPWTCQITLPANGQTLPDALAQCSTDEPPVPNPEHRAYVSFTSGSTGKPKAIVGTHSPVSHFLRWYRHTFPFTTTDHFSQLSGLAHDPLWRDIFTPLSVGATLYVPSPAQMETPSELATWLHQSEISVMHLTPAMGQLIREGAAAIANFQLSSLRYACFGGDILTRQSLDEFRKLAPHVTAINGYGATETPQLASYFVVPPSGETTAPHHGASRLPVGQGIEDTQLMIVNSGQALAGVGELGEIYVRTPYRSNGYLEGSLSQEKFVANPLTGDQQDICYKTGDYGRYLPDGNVEFLGRMDHQVKIRGFRIELGEIESALKQHSAVQQCVVAAREDEPGRKALVAYVVTTGEEIGASEWRQFLKRSLPDYMVPSVFVPLEALPLTPNGKIDRRALPKPDLSDRMATAVHVAPRTQTEEQLAQIWAEVLNLPAISVTDNFFDLGGHSLLTVRLTSQIEQQFGTKLPLSAVLTAPTVEQLAAVLDKENVSNHAEPIHYESVVLLRPGTGQLPLFLIHDADGETLVYRSLAQQLDPTIPVYALRPYSAAGFPLLHTRIGDMVNFYIEQIRQIQPEGPYFIGGLCAGGRLAFEVALQLQKQGQKTALLAIFDAADVGTPERGGNYANSQRLNRFAQVMKTGTQSNPLVRVLSIANKIRKKATNLLVYETQQRYLAALKHTKLSLFRYCLDRNISVPPFLRNIPVRTVIMWAGPQHRFDGQLEGEVLLYRATQKSNIFDGTPIDDTPAIEKYAEPLLGWDKRAAQVRSYDVPGGHASMLQDPNVKVLAEHLQAAINEVATLAQDANQSKSNADAQQAA